MKLSRYTLKNIKPDAVALPDESVFELPEKVLQFGTGVLLRGLPDYFIDKANKQNIFNGRIVVVKSTSSGSADAFEKQDGLFTTCIRGLQDGEVVNENLINASISRVLNASGEWGTILECAHNSNLQVIISNTTEVGIQMVNDDIRSYPPVSFPGKLLAFLYERFLAFGGSAKSGMVIIPTELIVDNGSKLQSIVLELAHLNSLPDEFIEWLENHNHFCNSLVDRIVPGKPGNDKLAGLDETLGYKDELLLMTEVYRLWAIEGNDHVQSVLSFAAADEGVVIVPDINIFRELKLRLLNGTHTLSCGLAFLAGCQTVKQAMDDEAISAYISLLMQNELAPAIPYNIENSKALRFAGDVLDRFRNPFIEHQWINITMNYSSKMKLRCVPLIVNHFAKQDEVPELMALGFAAYIAFMKPVIIHGSVYYGSHNGEDYLIQDEQAPLFVRYWTEANNEPGAVVSKVLSNTELWGTDLQALPGFHEVVTTKLKQALESGMKPVLESTLKLSQVNES